MATPLSPPLEATTPASATASASPSSPPSLPPESPNTPTAPPPYSISSTPFRGKTLIATTSLQPGEIVLIEPPLLVVSPHSPSRPEGSRCETEPGVGAIQAALSKCTKEEREAYMALGNSFKGRRAMQRWVEGGLLEGREGEEEALKVVGIWVTNRQGAFIGGPAAVWRTFSRLNHSCQPNCRFDFPDPTTLNPLILRASTRISPGEELTITYTSPLNPHVFRTILLKENYDFRCTCTICRLPPPKLAESDDNRRRLKELPDLFNRWRAGRTSGRAVLMEGAEIFRKGGVFDQEGIGGPERKTYYWWFLFYVAASHAAYAEAITYARRFLADWAIEKGNTEGDQSRRIEMEMFAQDPRSAPMWGSRLPEPLDPSLDFGGGGGGGGMGLGISGVAMGSEIDGESVIEGVKKKKKKKKKKGKKGKVQGAGEGEGAEAELENDDDEALTDQEGDCSIAPTPALLSKLSTPSTPTLETVADNVPATGSTKSPSVDAASSTVVVDPSSPADGISPAQVKFAAEPSSSVSDPIVEHPLPSKSKDVSWLPLSIPLPASPAPTSSPTANASSSQIVNRADNLKIASPTPPIAPAPLSESPPPSPPSAPTFDPSLSLIAAPPVSVDITKDELSQLAATRATTEEKSQMKEIETTIDEEGVWEKWPEEVLVEWKTVGVAVRKENGVDEKQGPSAVGRPEKEEEEACHHEDGWGAPTPSQQPEWEAPPFPTPPRGQLASTSLPSNWLPAWRRSSPQIQHTPLHPPRPPLAPLSTPLEKPRSKSTQRKAARKLKVAVAAAAPAASASARLPPGLPRPPPSSYAELVTPAPRPMGAKTRPSPPGASVTQSTPPASSSSVASSLPPTPDLSDLPATGWIRKSPIPSTPKKLAPPPPPPDLPSSSHATTSSTSTNAQEDPKPLVLATSAFLRRPTLPSVPTPSASTPATANTSAERLPSPTTTRSLASLALVEENEEEQEDEPAQVEPDSVGSLGLGLGAGPLGQLDDEEKEGDGEGDRFEDAFEEEGESSLEENEVAQVGKGEEVEGIEEKVRRMSGAEGGEGEEAFEDAEEEGGVGNVLGISFGGEEASREERSAVARSSAFAARPGNSPKKSVRFEAEQQEEEGRLTEEELPPPPPEWTSVQPHPRAPDEDSAKSPSLPPSPPNSPPQTRDVTSTLLFPPSRLPPFLRSDWSSSESHPSSQHVSSSSSAIPPPLPLPTIALPTPPLPAPTVGEVVEGWLSSTRNWEEKASQRRKLIAILNDGKDFPPFVNKVPLPPSRNPSPLTSSTTSHDTPATPKKPPPSAIATGSSLPKIEVEAPTPPPPAPPTLGPRYIPPARSRQGLIQVLPETIELAKVEMTLDLLAEEDRRVVKENLERVKQYPRSLPLSRSWTLFFTDSTHINRHSVNYNIVQTVLFTASSVSVLCGSLKSLASKLSSPGYPHRPIAEALDPGTSLAFFLEGAEPTWENEWNKQGGRFLLLPPKALFHPIFERLILLLAGSSLEQLILDQPITLARFEEEEGTLVGVVANRRLQGDRIELWVAGGRKGSKASKGWLQRLKKVLVKELLVDEESLKYKRHGS